MRDLLIGIDAGTSALKAVLFSLDGHVIASARHGYPMLHPLPDHAEQRAADWWEALVAAVRALIRDIDPLRICAIGLSTQGGTLQPVDNHGQTLCPAISWMDTRAKQQETIFREQIGSARMREITGWNLCGGLNALQILWLKQNRPDVFNSSAKFLSVAGYLTLRLTGRAAVDRSNAGVEQLLDVRTGCWSEPVLSLLEIDERRLADLVDAQESVGTLTAAAAKELGLSQNVIVSAGGHDQYCAALGAGMAAGNDRLIATGTAWAMLAALQAPPAAGMSIASISRHVAPGLWGALLSLDGGGASLEWLRNAIKPMNEGEPIPLEQMNALAAGSPAGADGLLFYPFFHGAEYPPELQTATAGFAGLCYAHDLGHMARAVMEGVACQAVWMLEALGQETGGDIILTGGAAKSELWTQIIADVAGRTLSLSAVAEVGCAGAAALAGTAAGLFSSPAQGAALLSGQRRRVHSGPDRETYRQVLANYQAGALRMPRT